MIDFAAHIIPPRMWSRIEGLVGPISQLGVERNPGLVDLDIRRRTIDRFAEHGYRQLVSLSLQGTEDPAVLGILADLCRAANDELREIVDRDPDRLVGALGAHLFVQGRVAAGGRTALLDDVTGSRLVLLGVGAGPGRLLGAEPRRAFEAIGGVAVAMALADGGGHLADVDGTYASRMLRCWSPR